MKRFWLMAILSLSMAITAVHAQAIDKDQAAIWLDGLFSASADNADKVRTGAKIRYPQVNKLLSTSQKELKGIMNDINDHQHVLEARRIATETKTPIEEYFLAVMVFEALGVKDALPGFNFVMEKLSLHEYEVNNIFSINDKWQQSVKVVVGRSHSFTFIDKVVLYLALINEYPEVRKKALKDYFGGKEGKAVASLAKVADEYHYKSISVRKNEKTPQQIEHLVQVSQQSSILNQESFLNYMERAFGKESISQWQERGVMPVIDSDEGLIAAFMAIMILYPNSAEAISHYAVILGGNQDSAEEAVLKQNKIVKALSDFYKSYEKALAKQK